MHFDSSAFSDALTEGALVPRSPEGPTPVAFVDHPCLHTIQLSPLNGSDPWHWVQKGWHDFTRCPGVGLFYGACFVVMGWLLLSVFREAPALTLALSAGFLLMGPVLALGLYYASMRLERGLRPDLGRSLQAWDSRAATLGVFSLVLLGLEMAWVGASLLVFAWCLDAPLALDGSLLALLDRSHAGFVLAYMGVGLVFATLIFAISVISLPLMLDQHIDAIGAIQVSLRLVRTQPGVMALWGCLLSLLVIVAMLPGFAGLLVMGPVLGHASWHAYRSAVQDVGPLVLLDEDDTPADDAQD